VRLYGYFRSSAAFRVRIALNLKNFSYEQIPVHLRKGEQAAGSFLALNPQGLVPALEDGGRLLTQSLAIIEYLEETRPIPPLLPPDAAGRARVRALALAVACDIHPLNNLRVLNYIKGPLKATAEQEAAWYRHWIKAGFDAIEAMLSDPAADAFCHGGRPSLADVCLVPQMFNAKRYYNDAELRAWPRIGAVFEACMAIPAFDLAQPSKQPDAEP
jgi:maleylacetoacetate isomerase